jgi:hypothetical protein
MRHSSEPPPIVSQSVKSVTAPPERPAASAKAESGIDPAYWRDLFEERAAIRQFDGGYSRPEAERLGWGELQNRWHMTHGERVPRDLCAGCRRPIGGADALDLIDGNRVHDAAGHDCLIRWGEHWRGAATHALAAMGLPPPAGGVPSTAPLSRDRVPEGRMQTPERQRGHAPRRDRAGPQKDAWQFLPDGGTGAGEKAVIRRQSS